MSEAQSAEDVPQKALDNLLNAVEGVLAYDWSDNDQDAVEAIERLRTATNDYGVVERLAADVPAVQPAPRIARCSKCERVAVNSMAGQRCFAEDACGVACDGTLFSADVPAKLEEWRKAGKQIAEAIPHGRDADTRG